LTTLTSSFEAFLGATLAGFYYSLYYYSLTTFFLAATGF